MVIPNETLAGWFESVFDVLDYQLGREDLTMAAKTNATLRGQTTVPSQRLGRACGPVRHAGVAGRAR